MARGLHVIAGEAKGVPLVVPKGARPTAARVREALFSVLGDVSGLAVLDLYAGSGALAIEALSRGAARAVLVDEGRGAVDACERNLAATHLDARARVHRRAVTAFLNAPAPAEAPFDLVFCDPPYEAADEATTAVLEATATPGWLADDARVVLERAERSGALTVPDGWLVGWERRYGDTLVSVVHTVA